MKDCFSTTCHIAATDLHVGGQHLMSCCAICAACQPLLPVGVVPRGCHAPPCRLPSLSCPPTASSIYANLTYCLDLQHRCLLRASAVKGTHKICTTIQIFFVLLGSTGDTWHLLRGAWLPQLCLWVCPSLGPAPTAWTQDQWAHATRVL